MLRGKIIDMGKGKLGFEHTSYDSREPVAQVMVWEMLEAACSGYSWCEQGQAIGREASIADGVVSCYLGQGNYVRCYLPERGSTKATMVRSESVPCPKVRKGIETRWRDGRWQKLLRAGWTNI
jgi:hypothetical protein